MQETAANILDLKNQQRVLAGMLSRIAKTSAPFDVHLWVEMLEAAGLDHEGRKRWHTEFERRAPDSHNEFLLSLGLTTEEIGKIRSWSREDIPEQTVVTSEKGGSAGKHSKNR
jgi:hypothetical protein